MKTVFKITIFAFICIFFSGCAVTNITSEPDGAEIWLNNKYIGTTPMLEFKVPQEVGSINKYQFKAYMEGYEITEKAFYESPTMKVREVIPSKIHFKLVPVSEKKDEAEPETKGK